MLVVFIIDRLEPPSLRHSLKDLQKIPQAPFSHCGCKTCNGYATVMHDRESTPQTSSKSGLAQESATWACYRVDLPAQDSVWRGWLHGGELRHRQAAGSIPTPPNPRPWKPPTGLSVNSASAK